MGRSGKGVTTSRSRQLWLPVASGLQQPLSAELTMQPRAGLRDKRAYGGAFKLQADWACGV